MLIARCPRFRGVPTNAWRKKKVLGITNTDFKWKQFTALIKLFTIICRFPQLWHPPCNCLTICRPFTFTPRTAEQTLKMWFKPDCCILLSDVTQHILQNAQVTSNKMVNKKSSYHSQQNRAHYVKGYGKLCQKMVSFLCTILIEVTWAFCKMCQRMEGGQRRKHGNKVIVVVWKVQEL